MSPSRLFPCVGLLVILCGGLSPRLARACSYAIPPPVTPMPFAKNPDVTPPQLFEAFVSGLERGIVPTDSDARGGCLTRSELWIDATATDDRTAPDQLAYRVERLRGNPPLHYDEPMSYMRFVWEEDPDEPLDFEIRVRAVDGSGNESNPIDLSVYDPGSGSPEAGCQLAPRQRPVPPVGAALLLALACWRLSTRKLGARPPRRPRAAGRLAPGCDREDRSLRLGDE
jgi:hypothetical protein